MNVTLDYTPLHDKMREFHASIAKYKCLTGGFGCGKTTTVAAELIALAMEFPGNEIDICRKTFGELNRSTRPLIEDMLPKEIVARPYSTVDHQIKLINRSYLQFFPLDEREKVKSLNSGAIFIDEASEIEEDIFLMLIARLRRKVPRKHMLIASNPTYTNHWLYKWFGQLEEGRYPDRFHRKLSTYDNPTLDADYLRDLERSLPPDVFRVYVLGEWGHVTFGTRMYPEFGPSLHGRNLNYNPDLPIIRGWDFGFLFPACVFLQVDLLGRIKVLGEMMGKNRLIEHFGEDVINYGLKRFPDARFEDYGDPAGAHKDPRGVSDKTATRVLRDEHNIHVKYKDVPISHGVNLIRRKLSTIVEGEPALLVDSVHCPLLMEGFSGGYACKQNNDGTALKDVPKDDGYFEHTQDALRSALVHKFKYDMNRFEKRKRGLPVYKPAFPGTSW